MLWAFVRSFSAQMPRRTRRCKRKSLSRSAYLNNNRKVNNNLRYNLTWTTHSSTRGRREWSDGGMMRTQSVLLASRLVTISRQIKLQWLSQKAFFCTPKRFLFFRLQTMIIKEFIALEFVLTSFKGFSSRFIMIRMRSFAERRKKAPGKGLACKTSIGIWVFVGIAGNIEKNY